MHDVISRLRRLPKFLRLPAGDGWLLLAALGLRLPIAAGVRWLPFGVWRRLLGGAMSPVAGGAAETAPVVPECAAHRRAWSDRVACAVARSEVALPVGTCLVRALTGYVLLRWRRCPGRVCIGVGWDEGRQLRSHAWLESEGRVLIGGSVDGLRALPAIGPPITIEGANRA